MLVAYLVLVGLVVFLAFALAGLLQRLMRLEAAVSRVAASASGAGTLSVADHRALRETFRRPTVVLVVDELCVTCRDALAVFMDFDVPQFDLAIAFPNPDSRVAMQSHLGRPFQHRIIDDSDVFNALDPGVHPSLVVLDATASILSVQPIGNMDALRFSLQSITEKEIDNGDRASR